MFALTVLTQCETPPAGGATSALPFDAGGAWTDIGVSRHVVSVVGTSVFVDMSHARRPNATGTVLDASRIVVTFPDENTYLGTFVTPTSLHWSGGEVWQKVFTGPQIFDLEGVWAVDPGNQPAGNIGMYSGIFQLDLPGRGPHGAADATGATTIRATFPGDITVPGTLRAPNLIDWSSGTRWRSIFALPIPPGTPQRQRPAPILC